jgi:hypothetical protein
MRPISSSPDSGGVPRHRRRFLGLASAAAAALIGACFAPSQGAAVLTCDTATGGNQFYPGNDSSRTYNDLFDQSRSIDHHLDNYVPQGLGVWKGWRGTTEDIFLIGMHHRDENANAALVYGISVSDGSYKGAAFLPTGAHVGGLKTHGDYMYIQQNTSTIRRYSLAAVRASLLSTGIQSLGNGLTSTVTDVSFFDIDGGYLYGGQFVNPDDPDRPNDPDRGLMRRYAISPNSGALTRDFDYGPIQIPKKAQGLLVLSNTWIFSTSAGRGNRSNIYVIRRGYSRGEDIESVRYRCFRAPVLSEELVGFEGRTYLSFEGGAAEFADGSENKIKNLHWADTEVLRGLVW